MTSTPSSKSFSSPWQDRWSSTTLPSKEALIGCVAVAILFAVRRFLFVPILDNPDEQERKLEKDQYIKERIADAIAAYKKEIGATSLRERAESSVNTAAADPLNEKEGSE